MKEYLVGHSIRSLAPDSDWDDSLREKFLINPLIDLPISVDSNVWSELFPFVREIKELGGISIPMAYWEYNMEHEMMIKSNYDPSNLLMVKLSIAISGDYLPESVEYTKEFRKFDSDQLYFLGYDIADDGPWSGLSNCEYLPCEMAYCRVRYKDYLNKYGLFNAFEEAIDFKNYTDKRVPEHSPFYIYSLYVDKLF